MEILVRSFNGSRANNIKSVDPPHKPMLPLEDHQENNKSGHNGNKRALHKFEIKSEAIISNYGGINPPNYSFNRVNLAYKAAIEKLSYDDHRRAPEAKAIKSAYKTIIRKILEIYCAQHGEALEIAYYTFKDDIQPFARFSNNSENGDYLSFSALPKHERLGFKVAELYLSEQNWEKVHSAPEVQTVFYEDRRSINVAFAPTIPTSAQGKLRGIIQVLLDLNQSGSNNDTFSPGKVLRLRLDFSDHQNMHENTYSFARRFGEFVFVDDLGLAGMHLSELHSSQLGARGENVLDKYALEIVDEPKVGDNIPETLLKSCSAWPDEYRKILIASLRKLPDWVMLKLKGCKFLRLSDGVHHGMTWYGPEGQKYIALSDKNFHLSTPNALSLLDTDYRIDQVLIHEIGHAIDLEVIQRKSKEQNTDYPTEASLSGFLWVSRMKENSLKSLIWGDEISQQAALLDGLAPQLDQQVSFSANNGVIRTDIWFDKFFEYKELYFKDYQGLAKAGNGIPLKIIQDVIKGLADILNIPETDIDKKIVDRYWQSFIDKTLANGPNGRPIESLFEEALVKLRDSALSVDDPVMIYAWSSFLKGLPNMRSEVKAHPKKYPHLVNYFERADQALGQGTFAYASGYRIADELQQAPSRDELLITR